MPGENVTKTLLFGGGFEIILPPKNIDSSNIRHVPDNQEVFIHENTGQSIIIEIMEYVPGENDQQACSQHFSSLAQCNSCFPDSWGIDSIMPHECDGLDGCTIVYIVKGHQKVSKFNETARNDVSVTMAVYRMRQYTSDVLITFNSPVQVDEDSSSRDLDVNSEFKWSDEHFSEVLHSFRLINPGLVFAE